MLLGVVLAGGRTANARAAGESRFVLLDPAMLEEIKGKLKGGDAGVLGAVEKLRASADEALINKPPSVVEKKLPLPVGSDPHDYMSLAIYYWPDPAKPDGKPYVSRDGEVNRVEVNEGDSPRKDRMISSVRDLALMYALTGEEKYAEGAAKYLRVWFLDPATKMNPNLDHGQYVPGQRDGRGFGIIETRYFVQLVDAVELLEGSKSWSAADRDGLKAWMAAYVDWLKTSKNGKEEYATKNNHGEWFDFQICGLARYVGKGEIVKEIAAEEGVKRIAKQMEADGSLPQEIARTKSLHYSMFALDAWLRLAAVSKSAGVDVYGFKTEDGRGIRKGLEYLAPYLLGEKKWEHQELGGAHYSDYWGMWAKAGKVYGEARFTAVAEKLRGTEDGVNLNVMLGW